MADGRILVVDDEPQIRRALRAGLAAQGYAVTAVASGEEALDHAALHPPDLIILDLMLPGLSGLEVCRRLREWSDVPILVLSAHGLEKDKVLALDDGADDYLTKPFGMDELLARVRAALRRQRRGQAEDEATVTVGDIEIDFVRRIVSRQGEEVRLTPLEYDVLRYLAAHADRVITHRQILAHVWGPENAEETQYLRVHIGHLRQKLERDPARPQFLVTEPGIGYRFRTSP
jgi:two-component system KDP operon response regulator KdpE